MFYLLYLSVKRIARCILSNLELSTSSEVFCPEKQRKWNKRKEAENDWETRSGTTT